MKTIQLIIRLTVTGGGVFPAGIFGNWIVSICSARHIHFMAINQSLTIKPLVNLCTTTAHECDHWIRESCAEPRFVGKGTKSNTLNHEI